MLDGRRILIVEDYSDASRCLEVFLAHRGVSSRTYRNGQAALDALSQDKPVALILDVGLPGMSGFELATAIRALPEGASYVLVGYSGHAEREYFSRALAAGMDAYFAKPTNIDVMLTEIQRLVKQKTQRSVAGLEGPHPYAPGIDFQGFNDKLLPCRY
jgi:DNA-binding response OmpR family regulator